MAVGALHKHNMRMGECLGPLFRFCYAITLGCFFDPVIFFAIPLFLGILHRHTRRLTEQSASTNGSLPQVLVDVEQSVGQRSNPMHGNPSPPSNVTASIKVLAVTKWCLSLFSDSPHTSCDCLQGYHSAFSKGVVVGPGTLLSRCTCTARIHRARAHQATHDTCINAFYPVVSSPPHFMLRVYMPVGLGTSFRCNDAHNDMLRRSLLCVGVLRSGLVYGWPRFRWNVLLYEGGGIPLADPTARTA